MNKDLIEALEAEISTLPIGYISKKVINGKTRFYHQWTEDGKKKSKYVDDEIAEQLRLFIEKRRQLQQQLKTAKALVPKVKAKTDYRFNTEVKIGESLLKIATSVASYQKRDGYAKLEDYLCHEYDGRVFVLCGLRRTGKTTLIRQAIGAMSKEDFERTAFIQVKQGDTFADINFDMKWLLGHGYKYVFIDEITLADRFVEGAVLFSDIYASSGMKVVLSGDGSLGFVFTKAEELYDRCIMLHTTLIPYREFERVLGVKGIDNYIRYGGTMSLGGVHYNRSSTFASANDADAYVDSAIAHNIQHSLQFYRYGEHFRHLEELYEKNELTSVINRVVEDINHRFTIDVLTRDFFSNDLGVSANNLRKSRNAPTDILDRIDKETFTAGLKEVLEILNKNEQEIPIKDAHRIEIKEYLDLLDLTYDVPIETIPVKSQKKTQTVISQPGLRYAQAEAFVRQLMKDERFNDISAVERGSVIERILNEIKGRMMEDIVLLETTMAKPEKEVFQLRFAIGEFDMVVVDEGVPECEIYEIKHSDKVVPAQYRFLSDPEKQKATEFRYGRIIRKAVIYRGESTILDNGIEYINVEEYLKSL